MAINETKKKNEKNKEYSRAMIGKIAIAIGLFVVLLLIPFTNTIMVSLMKFSWFVILWVLLLFAIIFVIRWVILRIR